jgi:MerR family transcriptional regulator, thiopeptide resistance regulator
MVYSIHQLAKLAGVSVRTLHYYDEIGLLRPSFVRPNGYRMYERKELVKLQEILFFRELEFPLAQIMTIMNAKNFSSQEALKDQRQLLRIKRERIDKLIATIDVRLKGGENGMDDAQLFGSFDQRQMDEYKEEAKKRWGNTEAWKQSQERTKHWTKEDYKRIADEGNKLTAELAKLMDRGAEDAGVQKMIAKHYQSIQAFYDCSLDMYRGLGQLYVDDPRFTAFYDKFAPGMAKFMQQAIAHYCDTHSK